jgi:alkaline phosphatase D
MGPKDTTSTAIDTVLWQSANRTLLGKTQYEWLNTSLRDSKAKWKVIGNQVMITPLDGFTNQDSWDGYPAERKALLSGFRKDQVNNVIFVTGDIHSTWISDLPIEKNDIGYDPATGKGSTAVEFVTPSISSANINELLNVPPGSFQTQFLALQAKTLNPHIKDVELDNHGYAIIDLTEDKAQSDWYFIDSMNVRKKGQKWYKGFSTIVNQNAVKQESSAIPIRPGGPQDPDATLLSLNEDISGIVIGNYPNPCNVSTLIHYVLAKDVNITLTIHDISGREVMRPIDAMQQQAGTYAIQVNTMQLPAGNYYYTIQLGSQILTRSFIIIH